MHQLLYFFMFTCNAFTKINCIFAVSKRLYEKENILNEGICYI